MSLTIFLPILLAGCHTGSQGRTEALPEHRYVVEADFSRIGEYFTGQEVVGNRIYLRSDPEKRAGYYWIIPAETVPLKDGLESALVEVQVPGSPEELTYSFRVDRPVSADARLWIGLTGEHWPDPKRRPVAWRLGLFSPTGDEVYSRESYLWSPPASGKDDG